jgi:lipopolysaccharide transport system ATP-binding protein
LLKILSRVTTQSSEQIKVTQAAWEAAEGSPQGETNGSERINGRIASLLEVGTGFHPELTGREPKGWEARRKSSRRLARRVQRRRGGANQNIFLNGAILGMRKAEPERRGGAEIGCRRRARRALRSERSANQILIVDEVLAVGDAEFQKKCLGKMKDVAGHGRTILWN